MTIYAIKIISILLHLVLIFSISSISTSSLGIYSFFVAIATIFSQISMFEGAQHAIAKKITVKDFYSYYFLNLCLWILVLSLIFFFTKEDLLALIFISIFILNLTFEKFINILTIDKRVSSDDVFFKKLYNFKNIFFEIFLPFLFILNIQNYGATFIFSVTFFSLSYLLIFVILIYSLSKRIYPKLMSRKFYLGIIYKKIDGLFIRLFTGFFWGYTSLGFIQPAMSIARSVSVLLPLWINLNLNTFFASFINKSSFKAFLWIPASYIFYILVSLAAWQFLKLFSFIDYPQSILILAFIWFGNANTKAVIRAISVFNGLLNTNNNSLIFSLIFKLLIAFFVPENNFLFLFFGLVVIDLIYIGILVYILILNAREKIND